MRPLDWLRELHLVADQYDVARGHAHCDNICETDLPCFVDKEIVESPVVLGAGEQPGRTRDELVGRGDIVVLQCLLDPAAGAEHLVLAAARSEEHTSELQSLLRNAYAVL